MSRVRCVGRISPRGRKSSCWSANTVSTRAASCPGWSCTGHVQVRLGHLLAVSWLPSNSLSLCAVCRKELSKTSDSPGAGAEAGGGADPLAGDQTQGPAGPAAAAGAAGGPGAAGGAGGGAGLTGFIQSTLNQMFGSSGWTGPSGPSGPPSHNHTSKLVLSSL